MPPNTQDTRRVIYMLCLHADEWGMPSDFVCPNWGCVQSAGTDAADWTSTFAGCGLTGPIYFEAGGSTNISLGGLAGSVSSNTFDNFGCRYN